MGLFNWEYKGDPLDEEQKIFLMHLNQVAYKLDRIPYARNSGRSAANTLEDDSQLRINDFKKRFEFCKSEKSKKSNLGEKVERYGYMFTFKANELVDLGRKLTYLIKEINEELAKTPPGSFKNFLTKVLNETRQKQQLLADLMFEEYVLPAEDNKLVHDHLIANQVKGSQAPKFTLPIVKINAPISKDAEDAENSETLLQSMQNYSYTFSPKAIFKHADDLFTPTLNQFVKNDVIFDQAQIDESFLSYKKAANQLAKTPYAKTINTKIEKAKELAITSELMPQLKAEKQETLKKLNQISAADILSKKHTPIANQFKTIYEQPLNNLRIHLEKELLETIKAKWKNYPDEIPNKGLDENLPVVKIYQATLALINTAIAPLLNYNSTQDNRDITEALKAYQTVIESIERPNEASERNNQKTIELAKQLLETSKKFQILETSKKFQILETSKKFQKLQDINNNFKSDTQIIENQLNTVKNNWLAPHCNETLETVKTSWSDLKEGLSSSLDNLAKQPSSNLSNTSIVHLNNATFNLMTAFFKPDTAANNIEDRIKQLRTAIATYKATLTEITNNQDATITPKQLTQATSFKDAIVKLTNTLEENTFPAVYLSRLKDSIASINKISDNISDSLLRLSLLNGNSPPDPIANWIANNAEKITSNKIDLNLTNLILKDIWENSGIFTSTEDKKTYSEALKKLTEQQAVLLNQFEALLSSNPEDREKNITALETACTNFQQAIDKFSAISTTAKVKEQKTQLTEQAKSLMKTTEEFIQNLKKEKFILAFETKKSEIKASFDLTFNSAMSELKTTFNTLFESLNQTTSLTEDKKTSVKTTLNALLENIEEDTKNVVKDKMENAKYYINPDDSQPNEAATNMELNKLAETINQEKDKITNFQATSKQLVEKIKPLITLSIFDKRYKDTLETAKIALAEFKENIPQKTTNKNETKYDPSYQEVYDQMSAIVAAKEKRLQNTSYAIIALTVFTLGIGYAIAKWRHGKKAEALSTEATSPAQTNEDIDRNKSSFEQFANRTETAPENRNSLFASSYSGVLSQPQAKTSSPFPVNAEAEQKATPQITSDKQTSTKSIVKQPM